MTFSINGTAYQRLIEVHYAEEEGADHNRRRAALFDARIIKRGRGFSAQFDMSAEDALVIAEALDYGHDFRGLDFESLHEYRACQRACDEIREKVRRESA